MWCVTYWLKGQRLVANVAAHDHNEAVYQFELEHRGAVILAVQEG